MIKTKAVSLVLLASWATAVSAAVTDAMDTTVGYAAEVGDSAAASTNHVQLVPGESSPAVRLKFNYAGSSGYTQLVRDFSLADFSPVHLGAKVGFSYRWTGTSNTLLLRLIDSDGDFQDFSIASPVTSGAWTRVEQPRSAFTLTANAGTDGVFDWFRVDQAQFAIVATGGGSGTLDVDRFELVHDSTTAATRLLDDFEGGPADPDNEFSQSTGSFAGNGTATAAMIKGEFDTLAANVHAGVYALKITHDFNATTHSVLGLYSPLGNTTVLPGHKYIEFYAKADAAGEAFELAFGHTVQQVIKIGGLTTSWQRFVVPLNAFDEVFRTGVGLAIVNEFIFRFVEGLSTTSGAVWVDDIRFVRDAAPATVLKVLDDMAHPVSPALTSWVPNYAPGAAVTASSIADGVDGRALRLTWSMGSGTYVNVGREWNLNAGLADSLKFRYQYDGSANTFQMNLLDADGVRFYRELESFSSTNGAWRSLTIPLRDFIPASSAQKTLNLRKLKDLRFTLVKTGGGAGSLTLDDFELGTASVALREDASKMIQRVFLDNPTFSPNADGVRDTVTFTYSLDQAAHVRLRVFDQSGAMVRELRNAGPDAAGESTLAWDGLDENGERVPNGLYFFQLKAEAADADREDHYSHLVAVIR